MKEKLESIDGDPEFAKLITIAKNWFHHEILGYNGAFDWYELPTTEPFESSEGQQMLQWKGKGYKFILDILMVRIFIYQYL